MLSRSGLERQGTLLVCVNSRRNLNIPIWILRSLFAITHLLSRSPPSGMFDMTISACYIRAYHDGLWARIGRFRSETHVDAEYD